MSGAIIDARQEFLERQLDVRINQALAETGRVLREGEAYLASLPRRDNSNDDLPSDCEPFWDGR